MRLAVPRTEPCPFIDSNPNKTVAELLLLQYFIIELERKEMLWTKKDLFYSRQSAGNTESKTHHTVNIVTRFCD